MTERWVGWSDRRTKRISTPQRTDRLAQLPARNAILTFAVGAAIALLASAVSAKTFTINSTADAVDNNPGDGSCFTGNIIVWSIDPPISEGECTLRAAILEANLLGGADEVHFDGRLPAPGGFVTIVPGSPLPFVTETLQIRGSSHPSYSGSSAFPTPIIHLSGLALAPATLASGIVFSVPGARSSYVEGLSIAGFPGWGIEIQGGPAFQSASIRVEGNHIGIRKGQFVDGNGQGGILISQANENAIGRVCVATCAGRGNVISGNGGHGLRVDGEFNLVGGNRIGTTVDGLAAVTASGIPTGNSGNGIWISDGGSNVVGSIEALPGGVVLVDNGNLVSANGLNGVTVNGGDDHRVIGNRIGTDLNGSHALGNARSGVVDEAFETVVGSEGLGSNLISGNSRYGILNNGEFARYAHNRIGLSASGLGTIPNGLGGILDEGFEDTIANNAIGGNFGFGIELLGTETSVVDNYVGTDEAGADFGNRLAGIMAGAGEYDIQRNVVGHNGGAGIYVSSNTFAVDLGHNWIGTNSAWQDIGNSLDGIESHSKFRIATFANRIGFNGGHGIALRAAPKDTTGEFAATGNYIGTNPDGDDLGNVGSGVFAATGPNAQVLIGLRPATPAPYSPPAWGNVIGWNGGDAVTILSGAGAEVVGLFARGNGGQAIDLANDGPTPNDPGDADTGPNDLLNTPEFDISATRYDDTTGELVIRYRVDSTIGSLSDDAIVDFYLYDPLSDPAEQLGRWVGFEVVPEADLGIDRTVRILPPAGSLVPFDGAGSIFSTLRATTTRSSGTSELSTEWVPVPEPAYGLALAAGGLLLAASRFGSERTPTVDRPRSGRRRSRVA